MKPLNETLKIYKNYGCLTAEKRAIYTYGSKQSTAVCADEITLEIPEGWKLKENNMGEILIESPWGWTYSPNELLCGNENPCFGGCDKDGKRFLIKLKVVEEDL